MTDAEKLKEFLTVFDDNITTVSGCEHAFVGVTNTKDGYRAIYSTDRIIANIMEDDFMDFETAEEFVHNNILSKDYGDTPPIFIDVIPDEFWKDDNTSLDDHADGP